MSYDNQWLGVFQGYEFPVFERQDIITRPSKPKRARKRRMTLARALTQAAEAGVGVGSATMNADGSVTLTFVAPGLTNTTDETSEDLRKLL